MISVFQLYFIEFCELSTIRLLVPSSPVKGQHILVGLDKHVLLVNHLDLRGLAIKLQYFLFLEAIGVDKVDHAVYASKKHLCAAVDKLQIDHVFDLQREVVLNGMVVEVEKFDELLEDYSKVQS